MKKAIKVVYLLGTGATQAEIGQSGETIGILMRDVINGILQKIDKNGIKYLEAIKNELLDKHADIEHLITLYESTGIQRHERIAKKLKKLFMEVILERTKEVKPRLLEALIDMHEIKELNEEISGILTINYEDILEQAIQSVKGGIDYSIGLNFKHKFIKNIKDVKIFPVLKLHGSFNWKNEFPIILTNYDKIKNANDALWIPPGIEKKRDKYPFNIIWGKAKEVLNCDILRIIGCSLNRNDWQLVSLLYTTQKLNLSRRIKRGYDIQLIDYYHKGKEISENYSYLTFTLISQISEIREYLIKSFSLNIESTEKLDKTIEDLLNDPFKTNIFDLWLKAKGDYLVNKNIRITTNKNIFFNYINEG